MTDPQVPQPVPTVNEPAKDAVTFLENVVAQGEDAAEGAIIASNPWMGAPIWKQVWEAAFHMLIQKVMRPIATYGGFAVVRLEEYKALKDAAAAQAALDAAKKAGDPDGITQASSQVDQAVATAIQYIGASK